MEIRDRILIGVCSSRKTAARRAAIRSTWMKQLPDNVQAVFFTGEGAGNGEPDLIVVSAADDYRSLPSKVHAFLGYALAKYRFDYLFKCDDDTYVVPERLVSLASGGVSFVGSSASAPHGFASGGAGYLLSRGAVRTAAQAPRPGSGAEDVWISSLLRAAGITLTQCPHLRPCYDELPQPANSLVTAHYCGPDMMHLAHRLMASGAERGRVVTELHARHACWQGAVKLLSDGMFLGGAVKPNGLWEWNWASQSLLLRWFHWPSDQLHLRDWGLEAPNLRLEFASGNGPVEWQRVMAEFLSPDGDHIELGARAGE